MVETDAFAEAGKSAEKDKRQTTATSGKVSQPSTLQQLKGAASDSYWWIIIIFYMLYQTGVMFKGGYVFNIFFFPKRFARGQINNIPAASGIPLIRARTDCAISADKVIPKKEYDPGRLCGFYCRKYCVSPGTG